MLAFPGAGPVAGWIETGDGSSYRHCENRLNYDNCNWLVSYPDPDAYCVSCRLNRTIPNLSSESNLAHWAELERAKRRLVFALLGFRLPVQSKVRGWPFGLAFDFIEDQRSNPLVEEEHVSTGHAGGVITINVSEADDVTRAMARKQMNESYRTLLGHFRHESGHYYFGFLVDSERCGERFRELFGDAQSDYDTALAEYYQNGPVDGWRDRYISAYASAHPAEDWAETWAHYLHMMDSLETAAGNCTLGLGVETDDRFASLIGQWMHLTVALNELNRSMGLRDAYPFVISEQVAAKLRFIHDLLEPQRAAS